MPFAKNSVDMSFCAEGNTFMQVNAPVSLVPGSVCVGTRSAHVQEKM